VNEAEYFETLQRIEDTTNQIIHNQRVLAGVVEELQLNAEHPFEQDNIYDRHFGRRPSDPLVHDIDGVEITTRILHQTGIGMRDIAGADLLYEIRDKKFMLMQFKRASVDRSRVTNDAEQLERLLQNCPEKCYLKKFEKVFSPIRFNGMCGIWYRVDSARESRIVHACEVKTIFDDRKSAHFDSFRSGVSVAEYESLFASCRIGAFIDQAAMESHVSSLVEQRHVVFRCLQDGMWQQDRR
jgi:hypothetical protein